MTAFTDIDTLKPLAQALLQSCHAGNITLATAESLTGGLIAATLSSIPGSSSVFRGGLVTYASEVKSLLLGVKDTTLRDFGVVSCETAREMALGVRQSLRCDLVVSVTGIAGPGGAEPGKPVGTVCFGVADASSCSTERCRFEGDRDAVRYETVAYALRLLQAKVDAMR